MHCDKVPFASADVPTVVTTGRARRGVLQRGTAALVVVTTRTSPMNETGITANAGDVGVGTAFTQTLCGSRTDTVLQRWGGDDFGQCGYELHATTPSQIGTAVWRP